MLSTAIELLGFAAIIAATYLLGGVVPALYVTGAVLLLIGQASEDLRLRTRRLRKPVATPTAPLTNAHLDAADAADRR